MKNPNQLIPSMQWGWDVKQPDTIDRILEGIADGKRLKNLCHINNWPYMAVYNWIKEDPALQQKFAGALEACGLDLAQEGMEIVDEAKNAEFAHHVTAAKIRADYRFRMASRINRNQFGETPAVNINAAAGSLISILSSLPPIRAPEEIDVTPDGEE